MLTRSVLNVDAVQVRLAKLHKAHVDRDAGDNKTTICKRYGVSGYPTLVFTDAAGVEVDRIVGGKHDPAEFAATLDLIVLHGGRYPYYARQIAAAPKDPELRWKRIALTRRARNWELVATDAPAFLDCAPGDDPRRAEALLLAGQARTILGRREAGIADLRAFLERHPRHAEVHFALLLLGGSYSALGRIDDADRCYRRIIVEFGGSRSVGAACSFYARYPQRITDDMPDPTTRNRYALQQWQKAKAARAALNK